jgi:hypothetical protein
MLAGCMYRGNHSDPGISEPSCMCVYGVLGTANSVFGSLQLDYCGAASQCVELYVMYMSGGSPLHHFRFVDVLFGGGVPGDRSVFKCWSSKGLIRFSVI